MERCAGDFIVGFDGFYIVLEECDEKQKKRDNVYFLLDTRSGRVASFKYLDSRSSRSP